MSKFEVLSAWHFSYTFLGSMLNSDVFFWSMFKSEMCFLGVYVEIWSANKPSYFIHKNCFIPIMGSHQPTSRSPVHAGIGSLQRRRFFFWARVRGFVILNLYMQFAGKRISNDWLVIFFNQTWDGTDTRILNHIYTMEWITYLSFWVMRANLHMDQELIYRILSCTSNSKMSYWTGTFYTCWIFIDRDVFRFKKKSFKPCVWICDLNGQYRICKYVAQNQ